MAADGTLQQILVHRDSVELNEFIELFARRFGVPARELRFRALLELPRVASARGLVTEDVVTDLLADLAEAMPTSAEWRLHNEPHSISTDHLELREVGEATAAYISTRFHYIRSHRAGGVYYGLFTEGIELPLTLFVLTELDESETRVPIPTSTAQTYMLARVFSFHDSPQNSLSFGLAALGKKLAGDNAVRLLTHVNPNVGFDGASYRSAGWTEAGDEPFDYYTYLNGRYVTEREELPEIGRMLGARSGDTRVERSVMALEPKMLLQRVYGPPLRRRFANGELPYQSMTSRERLPILVFDGDDTLWRTQHHFVTAQSIIQQITDDSGVDAHIWQRLLDTIDRDNVKHFGFSKRRFPHSCVQAYRHTAIANDSPISKETIRAINWHTNSVFRKPAMASHEITEVLTRLRSKYRLALFVQGDIEVQRARVLSSGLYGLFDVVRFTEWRSTAEFRGFIESVRAPKYWSIGNSLRLDVHPAVDAGMNAIWIDAPAWDYETGGAFIQAGEIMTLSSIADLVELL